MFYDTPDPTAPRRNRLKSWILRLLVLFILGWIVWVLMISLFSQAKNIPKEDIERTLGDTLGVNVTIGALQNFTLYPKVGFTGQDIRLSSRGEKPVPYATIGTLDMQMDFGQAAYYRGSFEKLDITNASLLGASFGLPALTIDQTQVKLSENQSRFVMQGKAGPVPYRAVLPLARVTKSGQPDAFSLLAHKTMTLVMDDATYEGKLFRTDTGLAVQPLRMADQVGTLTISRPDAAAATPLDIILALPLLKADMLTDPRHPVAVLLAAALPVASKMNAAPPDMKGATTILRLSAEQWQENGKAVGPVTLVWVYRDGHWAQPVIANHNLTTAGLQGVQSTLLRLSNPAK
ncbi:MAG: hypothetical protein V4621_03625 [Pseudomonadota bacterium]